MSYIKAAHVLPQELIAMIQEYVDGEFIYIPRIPANKRGWGEKNLYPPGIAGKERAHLRRLPFRGAYGGIVLIFNQKEPVPATETDK